ncbi:hypothetical protein ACFVZM_24855 [Streptomyces sioyaensis]|uniref:hypothetical protein n=1 Tax=Streptomyces sioyaensis TaxID=67364 RepID=UPI00368FE5AB
MTVQRRERATQLATHQDRPVMWATTPVAGAKVLAVRLDYGEQAAPSVAWTRPSSAPPPPQSASPWWPE